MALRAIVLVGSIARADRASLIASSRILRFAETLRPHAAQAPNRAAFVAAHQPRVADDVRRDDRCQSALLAHGWRFPQIVPGS
jgi:hypothetical protein